MLTRNDISLVNPLKCAVIAIRYLPLRILFTILCIFPLRDLGVMANNSVFQQQGQLDWVAASRNTVSFSLDILKRISDADIDAYTLVVAQKVVHQLHMHTIGQQRVLEAIKKL